MLTLYIYGPAWGLPDPSPFVVKTMVHLKMAGIEHRYDATGFPRAPKGKLPFIEDGGKIVADSTFIRDHIEQTYNLDLDRNLTAAQRAHSWAIERMLEDHLYWAQMHLRWADDGNFEKGPSHFFDGVPEEAREQARQGVRKQVLQDLHGHGLGRHSPEEITDLATRSLRALSETLGNKPYMMGELPSGIDAAAFSFFASISAPYFSSPIADAAAGLTNMAAYRDRMMSDYFPRLKDEVELAS